MAWRLQVQGAPTIVVGIPVRYAHTPHCYVRLPSGERLVIQLIKNLDADKIQALVQPLSRSGTNEDLCIMRY